jgi:hypothetical protein
MNIVSGTFDLEQIVTLRLDGFKPIPGLRKESEWHGMFALRHESGDLVIVRQEKPDSWAEAFSDIFGDVFGRSTQKEKPARLVVVMASPRLLDPIKPEAA